jgi:hypothetical protein
VALSASFSRDADGRVCITAGNRDHICVRRVRLVVVFETLLLQCVDDTCTPTPHV